MKRLSVLCSLMACLAVATSAFAIDTTMADLFTAANISGLNNNVGTLLLAIITISLLFVGKHYIVKALPGAR